jgi:hypothetical protein
MCEVYPMAIAARRYLLTFLSLLFPLASTAVAQFDPNDTALRQLQPADSAEAKYLREHPGATALPHKEGQLHFRNSDGGRATILGNVTRRDPQTGNWVPNAPVLSETKNGWRIDGAAHSLLIRKQGDNQHSVTQAYVASLPNSSLTLTLPALTYDKGLNFRLSKDGLDWNLTFDQTGAFDLTTIVAAKRGAAVYTLDVSSSEPSRSPRPATSSPVRTSISRARS